MRAGRIFGGFVKASPLVPLLLAAVLAGCNIGNKMGECPSGQTCTCDVIGNCIYECPGGKCNFRCKGTGNCIFSCGGGDCDLVCENTGNCTMDCPDDSCSVTCKGTGNCFITGCPGTCKKDSGTR
jgi:hypothetical protein